MQSFHFLQYLQIVYSIRAHKLTSWKVLMWYFKEHFHQFESFQNFVSNTVNWNNVVKITLSHNVQNLLKCLSHWLVTEQYSVFFNSWGPHHDIGKIWLKIEIFIEEIWAQTCLLKWVWSVKGFSPFDLQRFNWWQTLPNTCIEYWDH